MDETTQNRNDGVAAIFMDIISLSSLVEGKFAK